MALPEPITRLEKYWAAILDKIQGGGSSVTVEPLTVMQNGTTTAPSGKAYSPVTTNVPNSYGASDEGKVVSNGALVAQTAHAPVTANGTIDTTLYNSVPVNVDGNPNAVETISGTLANPWGDYGFSTLASEIASQAVSCYITAGSKVYIPYGYSSQSARYWAGGRVTATKAVLESLTYDSSGGLTDAKSFVINTITAGDQTVQVADTSASTESVLTIIHHPLPDSE